MNTTTTTRGPVGGPGTTTTGHGRRSISRYHPILFGLIAATALALLGLTAWQRHQQHLFPYGGSGLTSRLDFLIFLSVWTFLFAAAYIIFAHTGKFGAIASHASHVLWLFVTWVMWLIGAALYHHRISQVGCGTSHMRCQINRAIKALSWLEFALCFLTMLIIMLHVGGKTSRYRSGPYDGQQYA